MNKDALLGELARAALSDIPGTPRLLMRSRSPQELGALQHNINSLGGLKYKAEDAVHGLADKVFTPRVSGAVKSVASMGIRNPEIIPMQGLPIPGLTPAYLAAKRGLEKGIEKISPVYKDKAAFAVSQYSGPLNPSIPSQASSAPGFLAPNLQSPVQKRKQAVSEEWVKNIVGTAKAPLDRLEHFAKTMNNLDSQRWMKKWQRAAHADRLHEDRLAAGVIRPSTQDLGKGGGWIKGVRDTKKEEVRKAKYVAGEGVARGRMASGDWDKQAAGAPTRGNFYMSSDIPSFNPPDLKSVIQKRSEFDGKSQPNEGEQKMADGVNHLSGLDEPNRAVNKLGDFEKKPKKSSFATALEKDSDFLPDYVTYNQGDFKKSKYALSLQGMATFVEQLRKVAVSSAWVKKMVQGAEASPERLKDFASKSAIQGKKNSDKAKYLVQEVARGSGGPPGIAYNKERVGNLVRARMRRYTGALAAAERTGTPVEDIVKRPPTRPGDAVLFGKKAASGNSIMGVSPTLSGATNVAKAVGAPKLSGPGPSIAQQVKPKGPHFGTGIAGAFKGSIGGRAPQDLS